MDDKIKAEYFTDHFRARIGEIMERQYRYFEIQRKTISPSRGKILGQAIERMRPEIRKEGGGAVMKLLYPLDIRFLDMKRIANWRIYNRVLWGAVYKDLLHDIKYEFRDWLKVFYPEELKNAGYIK